MPDIAPEIAEDLVRFWAEVDSGLERVTPTWWGAVVTDLRFPGVWDTNYARVETADPALSLAEVSADLEPALEAAGADHTHVVLFRPDLTARLLDELTVRGDRSSWDVVMTHEGDDPPPVGAVVEELRMDGDDWDRLGAALGSFGVDEPAIVDQLVRLEREVMAPAGKRWFGVRGPGGEVLAFGALVQRAGLGYVDDIVTFPEARGRGHARDVVTRIVHEARSAGVRRIFLMVDPEGPVRLYEGLGFREATRIASTRARRQLVAGGGR
jgi:ribosomal protein S18 acetylase RimI-like enzyme